MAKLKKIGLISKLSSEEPIEVAREVAKWLEDKGVEVICGPDLAKELGRKGESLEDLGCNIDAMVSLGGDGTLLWAARILQCKEVPILGFNLGGLGFLTVLNQMDDLYPALEKLITGEFETDERMLLNVKIKRDGKIVDEKNVLNDVVIRGTESRLIKLETKIADDYVTTFRADGVIISSPTGSTAYALSANGPILYPTIHSLVLVPICSFNLTNRPVVVPDTMKITVRVIPSHTRLNLTYDGQIDIALEDYDEVEVTRSDKSVYLVKSNGASFFEILRERLAWEQK